MRSRRRSRSRSRYSGGARTTPSGALRHARLRSQTMKAPRMLVAHKPSLFPNSRMRNVYENIANANATRNSNSNSNSSNANSVDKNLNNLANASAEESILVPMDYLEKVGTFLEQLQEVYEDEKDERSASRLSQFAMFLAEKMRESLTSARTYIASLPLPTNSNVDELADLFKVL